MPVSTDQINVNWTLENLETRIKDNSEYINSLIGLIPPKYYFKNDPNNDETNSNTKINDEFQPNKRKRFSKQELKKQKKEAKKQKLDPNNLKTVLDIHKERLLNINQQKSSIDNDDDDDDDDNDDDDDDNDDDKEISDDNDDFDDDKSESEIDNEEKSNQSIHQLQPKVQISTAERLARIRQVKESSSSQSLIKSNSKKSKQKRKSEEKKKKKQKSKINKQLKKESVNNNNNNNNNKEALHNDDDDIADDGNKKIKFAKFDFEQKNKKTKKQDNIHLINKLKKKSENFKKLERKDPEKAMIVKEKDVWNKVFRKAEGEKVKDDLKLLKKTVKRGAIKKKKSEKSWNERIETIAKNINEKQEKRKSNIQTRIEEKKKKKMKKRK